MESRSGDWRTVRTRFSLVFSSCVKALRCLGSLSCCSMNPSPPRSNQRVEHVSEERVVLLLGQGGVSSVQESENSPRHESSSSMFQFGFKHCSIILSAVCLLTYISLLVTLIYHWDSSVNRLLSSSTVKFWYFLTHLKCLSLFPPEKWVRNCCISSETLQDSFF